MNPVERVLHQELTGLLDRLATSVPEGGFESIRAANPTLKTRLDDADAKLAAVRESLLDGYGRWRRALEDLENLWAPGGQPRPKSRPSRPRRSPPDSICST